MKHRLSACPDAVGCTQESPTPAPLIVPKGARFTKATVGGIPGEWVEVERRSQGTLVYLHGGGYVCMSSRSHRAISAGFALRGLRVFAADYRLAPEHKFPAAVDDAMTVWRALRAEVDGPIFVAGNSAGGGLSLALMLNLRAHGERLPDAACLFSPWTDLTCTSDSMREQRSRPVAQYRRSTDAGFGLCGRSRFADAAHFSALWRFGRSAAYDRFCRGH